MSIALNRSSDGCLRGYVFWSVSTGLVDHAQFVNSVLVYDPRDPLTVTLTLWAKEPVKWILGRDLLAEGMLRPVGIADVHVACHDRHAYLSLCTPRGHAVLSCLTHDLEAFLTASFDAVPGGSEDLDSLIDDVLAAWFPVGGAA